MFENAELGHTTDKDTYKQAVPVLRAELLEAQKELATAPFSACRRRPSRPRRKGQAISALDVVRDRTTCLAAHGGLVGMPRVSIPGVSVNRLPVGLSIIGAHHVSTVSEKSFW